MVQNTLPFAYGKISYKQNTNVKYNAKGKRRNLKWFDNVPMFTEFKGYMRLRLRLGPVVASAFAFFFFFFHVFWDKFYYYDYCLCTVHEQQPQSLTCQTIFSQSVHTVHYSRTHKFHFSAIFLLKIGSTVLFTYLKIILRQYFSIFSCIQTNPHSLQFSSLQFLYIYNVLGLLENKR